MSKILDLKRVHRPPLGFRSGVAPQSLTFRSAQPATLDLGPGGRASGTCLRCPDQPCINYGASEGGITSLATFPSDPTSDVCPTGAIAWPDDAATPLVEPSICVSCGICATRCPTGAIYLDSTGSAVVHSQDSVHVVEEDDARRAASAHTIARRFLTNAQRGGALREANDETILAAQDRVNKVGPALPAKFPTLMVRNLLRTLGVRAESRRLGDVNVRMDIVYAIEAGGVGTCEVEFAASTLLDTPRNILDNLAVLLARYRVPKASARGLIVGISLPNERSEFWQVLTDIQKVLGIDVAVATVPALYVLVWSRSYLSADGLAALSVQPGTRSIRGGIEKALGRRITLSSGAGGVLESTK